MPCYVVFQNILPKDFSTYKILRRVSLTVYINARSTLELITVQRLAQTHTHCLLVPVFHAHNI